MKKLIAILMTLCLLGAACAALADTEPPVWDSMPEAVLEGVDEASFEGEWVLNVAFAGFDYADNETLVSQFDYAFVPVRIADGIITRELQNEYGEFVPEEFPYTFTANHLEGTDAQGRSFAVDLLTDGNICITVFYPGEGDTKIDLNLFMVHPAE